MESLRKPKKIDAAKSKMRSKSTRKPLQEVPNANASFKSLNNSKKFSEEDGGQTGGDSLDRLLLVHSDISSLLRQIDELVVQALQMTGDEEKDIKIFADLLSDMQTSLKPWVPKFQKAISRGSDENKPEHLVDKPVICKPKESTGAVIQSPENKWESLISPSPLVSWRAEWNTEGGRQLFLLTPLPQTKTKTKAKMFSSKLQASSIPALENMTFEETAQPVSLFNSVGNLVSNVPESVLPKPPGNKVVDTHDDICPSPANTSKMDCPMFVMSPCLKLSPPKSCILLEPASVFSNKKNLGSHKSTPFPAVVQNSDSVDSQSSSWYESSDDLMVMYPELFGINMNNLGKKVVEDSPNWIVSPPKTCVIMEPPDEKSLNNLRTNFLPARTTPVCNQKNKEISAALSLVESTPMIIMEAASNFRMGKHPGENTLKRELWTKFEAASSHSINRFDPSTFRTSMKKGFLDQLEEAFDA